MLPLAGYKRRLRVLQEILIQAILTKLNAPPNALTSSMEVSTAGRTGRLFRPQAIRITKKLPGRLQKNCAAKDHGIVKYPSKDVGKYSDRLTSQNEILLASPSKGNELEVDSHDIQENSQGVPRIFEGSEANSGKGIAKVFEIPERSAYREKKDSILSPAVGKGPQYFSGEMQDKNLDALQVPKIAEADDVHISSKQVGPSGERHAIQNDGRSISPMNEATPKVASWEHRRETQVPFGTEDEIVKNSLKLAGKYDGDLVGKYIELLQGPNNLPRKAFVEIHDVIAGTHIVEFCDRQGGTDQVYLTAENHRILDDKEVKMLCRRLGLTADRPTPAQAIPVEELSPHQHQADDDEEPMVYAEPHANIYKRKAASAEVAATKPRASQRLRTTSELKLGPGEELIGKCIRVRWPGNGGVYDALVLGFQNRGIKNQMHKLYYTADESTEVLDLSKREWKVAKPGTEPWDRNGLVGKRLVVYWQLEDLKEIQEQKRGRKIKENIKVPFEAFVVQFIDKFMYRLLYTQDDSLDERDLHADQQAWDLLDPGVFEVDNMPVVSWSYNIASAADENPYL